MMIWMKKAFKKQKNRDIIWLVLEKEERKKMEKEEIFKV